MSSRLGVGVDAMCVGVYEGVWTVEVGGCGGGVHEGLVARRGVRAPSSALSRPSFSSSSSLPFSPLACSLYGGPEPRQDKTRRPFGCFGRGVHLFPVCCLLSPPPSLSVLRPVPRVGWLILSVSFFLFHVLHDEKARLQTLGGLWVGERGEKKRPLCALMRQREGVVFKREHTTQRKEATIRGGDGENKKKRGNGGVVPVP
jgi:hypothetical protein